MDLDQAISGRRSVREYRNLAVEERMLRQLVDAAIQAPSAMNQQPWTFAIVRDPVLLDRISREAKRMLLATTPAGPQAEHMQTLLGDPDFHLFYKAPVLVLICGAEAGPWVVEDCALAAENLMLAAHAAGLGSCWIGFATGYLASATGKELLGLPPAWVPVAPIILGHPTVLPPPVARKPPQLRWIG